MGAWRERGRTANDDVLRTEVEVGVVGAVDGPEGEGAVEGALELHGEREVDVGPDVVERAELRGLGDEHEVLRDVHGAREDEDVVRAQAVAEVDVAAQLLGVGRLRDAQHGRVLAAVRPAVHRAARAVRERLGLVADVVHVQVRRQLRHHLQLQRRRRHYLICAHTHTQCSDAGDACLRCDHVLG